MAGRYPDAATGHPEGDRPQPVTHRQPSDHTQNQHDDKDDDEDPDNAVTRTKRQDNRHAPPPIEQFRGMRAPPICPDTLGVETSEPSGMRRGLGRKTPSRPSPLLDA